MRFVFVYNNNFSSKTIKSNVISIVFIGLVCFSVCLNIRLYHVYRMNNMATLLLSAPSSASVLASSASEKSLLSFSDPTVVIQHTQQLSFEAAKATTKTTMYSKSTTLPQWMKGTY